MCRKVLSAAALLLAGIVWMNGADAKEVKLAPGAACFVWNVDTPVMPKSVPVGGFVDNGTKFHADNITGKIRGLNRRFFAVWEGYVKVPKAGNYAFALTVGDDYVNAEVFINQKSVLKRRAAHGAPRAVTGSAQLPGGMAHVRIFFNSANNWNDDVSLKFGPAAGMKRTDITPEKMYHEPEDEE